MSATDLPQTITFWLPVGKTVTGGKLWSPGEATPARIAYSVVGVTSKDGKTQTFHDAVYVDADIPIGAYVHDGEAAGDLAPTVSARRVIRRNKNPTMTDLVRLVI